LKPVHLGDYLKLSVNAKEAKIQAEEILKQQGVDAKSYVTATIFCGRNGRHGERISCARRSVCRRLNEIYEKRVPGALWHIRFFSATVSPKNIQFVLRPDGGLHSVHHDVGGSGSGRVTLQGGCARESARFLVTRKGINLSQWRLVEATSEKRAAPAGPQADLAGKTTAGRSARYNS